MLETILELARTVSGAGEAETALLEALCQAAETDWTSRLREGVTAADCGAVTTGQEGDHTTLRTPLRLRLLYLDESGAPVTAERTDEAAAPVPGDVTTARAACLSPSLRPSGTGLELTAPVELTVERSRRCTWDAITAAELTEPEPGRRPSLVLCRPKKGESLWELAKRYRTDEQAICAANGLEQETPLPSGLLLIPRVR